MNWKYYKDIIEVDDRGFGFTENYGEVTNYHRTTNGFDWESYSIGSKEWWPNPMLPGSKTDGMNYVDYFTEITEAELMLEML